MLCRKNGLTIALFMLPSLALMKVPVLGAAVVFPMAASAAWLVSLLEDGKLNPDAPKADDKQQGQRHVPAGEDTFFGHGSSLQQPGGQQNADGGPAGSLQGQGAGSGANEGYSSRAAGGQEAEPSAPQLREHLYFGI